VCFFSGGTLHMLTGRSIYAWVERLVPYLDGRSDLAQLTANLPAEKAAMVENIVSVMLARGLVRDADRDEPHDLADWELDGDAEEIA